MWPVTAKRDPFLEKSILRNKRLRLKMRYTGKFVKHLCIPFFQVFFCSKSFLASSKDGNFMKMVVVVVSFFHKPRTFKDVSKSFWERIHNLLHHSLSLPNHAANMNLISQKITVFSSSEQINLYPKPEETFFMWLVT